MTGISSALDDRLSRLHRAARSSPVLLRLAIGTRILLAVAFIPTGLVKLLGRRFMMSPGATEGVGGFFEILYQSGLFWRFIGLSQLAVSLLILIPATAAIGAVLFLPIILSIFVVTLSYDFNYTPVVTGLMVLAGFYLLAWDYDRWKTLIFEPNRVGWTEVPRLRLSGVVERAVYVAGLICGVGLMMLLRSLLVPRQWFPWLLAGCAISLVAAIGLWLGGGKRVRHTP